MIGPRRQSEARDRRGEQCSGLLREPAETRDFVRRQPRVEFALSLQSARSVPRPRAGPPLAESSAVSRRYCASPIRSSTGSGGDLDVDVDAIDQRAGNAVAVADYLLCRAVAAAAGIARITAGTGIHRGDQLESRRELAGAFQPRDDRPRRSPAVRAMPRARCAEIRAVRPGTAHQDAQATIRRAAMIRRRSAPPSTPCVAGCGTAGGRRDSVCGPRRIPSSPPAEFPARDKGGNNPGRRCASRVLPAPGGPIIKSPCSPAAAISKARLAAILAAHLARDPEAVCVARAEICSGSCGRCAWISRRSYGGAGSRPCTPACRAAVRRGFSAEAATTRQMIHQAQLGAAEQACFERIRGRQNHFAAELCAGDERRQELRCFAQRASQATIRRRTRDD